MAKEFNWGNVKLPDGWEEKKPKQPAPHREVDPDSPPPPPAILEIRLNDSSEYVEGRGRTSKVSFTEFDKWVAHFEGKRKEGSKEYFASLPDYYAVWRQAYVASLQDSPVSNGIQNPIDVVIPEAEKRPSDILIQDITKRVRTTGVLTSTYTTPGSWFSEIHHNYGSDLQRTTEPQEIFHYQHDTNGEPIQKFFSTHSCFELLQKYLGTDDNPEMIGNILSFAFSVPLEDILVRYNLSHGHQNTRIRLEWSNYIDDDDKKIVLDLTAQSDHDGAARGATYKLDRGNETYIGL
jgi:hypothetical protein